eukprot:CAMPEP_0167808614 /NCGR_PEP_ID=MMETSP0111_2-20121227/23300_1 /TAXON_ID=91324 /ORGANISM="Lotharella globosa, Strain CCCM811" /LENGTH=100 /DNA_ID=CAMNT_0007706835 /DNA_START=636 /DNA_END=938 /DNA_ORIENTATION=-
MALQHTREAPLLELTRGTKVHRACAIGSASTAVLAATVKQVHALIVNLQRALFAGFVVDHRSVLSKGGDGGEGGGDKILGPVFAELLHFFGEHPFVQFDL